MKNKKPLQVIRTVLLSAVVMAVFVSHSWYGWYRRYLASTQLTDYYLPHPAAASRGPPSSSSSPLEPESSPEPTMMENPKNRSQYAYAYVIGGVYPEDPSHRYFLYNIVLSTHIQRTKGSVQDVVVLIQMSYYSKHNTLPDFDRQLLHSLNIEVRYIAKTREESFYRIMLDKFRILTLPYSKILFMDGDVLARTNLDYLFGGFDNMVIAGNQEPANGGFFLLQNTPRSWERVLAIIGETKKRAETLPYPHFDPHLGWGRPMNYTNIRGYTGDTWSFHGAFADQGLLYHWVMFEVERTAIVFANHVKFYKHGIFETKVDLVVSKHQPKCFRGMRGRMCAPPHSDFIHFVGRTKPWFSPPPRLASLNGNTSARDFWFQTLMEVDEIYGYGINFTDWKTMHKPILGAYPTFLQMRNTNFTGDA